LTIFISNSELFSLMLTVNHFFQASWHYCWISTGIIW